MKRLLLFIGVLFLASGASAQEGPIVTAEITPQAIGVGQSAQLRVTVLVPTWFPTPPVFPSFELSNAITRLPADSSFPTSQRIGRNTWSGIVRNYRVYPLIGASYRLSDQTITVTYANPGSDPIIVDVAVPDIEFRGVVPDGAEGLDPYIAGSNFTIRREVDGELDSLGTGDAIVVRYIAELEGLPAMFIPPLAPLIDAPGLSAYPDSPVVEDGDPARRTETITLVFEAGGEFSLPGVEVQWWNIATREIETVAIEPLTFAVTGPPPASAPREEPVETDWRSVGVVVLVLGVLLLAARRVLPALRDRVAARRAEREQTEQFAFRQLQQSLVDENASEAYQRLLVWLERISPGYDLRRFARAYGDRELDATLSAFVAALYSVSATQPDVSRLSQKLAEARHACLRQQSRPVQPALPTLNP
mgnify:CR=1 FL=1